MGDVSSAMEWVLREQAQASVVEVEGEGEIVRRGSVGCGYGFEEVENGDGVTREEEVDDDDVSDLEWEGWARDLERQCRVRMAKEKEEEERRRKLSRMRIKVDNRPTTRSWVVAAPTPMVGKLEQISQPLTFATPFEHPTFTSPFVDVSDSPPPTPLSPLPISPPSPPSLTPPPSLSPPPPTPIDPNAPEHHGTTAGAHYNRQYHPYTFQRRSMSPLLPGEVGAGASEQGDEQPTSSPTSPMSRPRMTHTITSTVSVGLGNGEVADGGSARRRSATISVPSRLLRKKDKEKDKDKGKGKGKRRDNERETKRTVEREDDITALKASTSSKDTKKAKFAAGVADPPATSITSSSADSHLDSHRLTQSVKGVVPDPQRPSSSSTTPLRHARSQSNLQRGTSRCGETASNGSASPSSSSLSTREPTIQDPGTCAAAPPAAAPNGGKKRSKIVRGVSVHAERFVRGLDSALDFVDGRAGS